MIKLSDYFDDFTIHARVMPVIVASIPLITVAIWEGIKLKSLQDSVLFSLLTLAFIAFVSKICREFGKKYEGKMFKKLDGMPTTIILRFNNTVIDRITKERYHKKLNEKIENLDLPLNEESENAHSDEKYITAINWLRKYANTNKDKEVRVYQELKEYNYWRNLYGIKIICNIIYSLVVLIQFLAIKDFSLIQLITSPYPKYISLVSMVIYLILFSIVVNKKTVKNKAFDYARTLLEVCDNL